MLDASSTTCPRRWTCRRSRAPNPSTERAKRSASRMRRAVRGAGLQDCHRPVRRPPGLPPGLLRHAQDRLVRLQLDQGDQRERFGRLLRCTPTSARTSSEVNAGDIVAAVGPKNTFTGDTLCDQTQAARARGDQVPGAGHPRRHRAEDQGTTRTRWAIALQQAGRRRPDLPGRTDEETRPDPHLRHGRAAPRGHRRPHAARVRGQRQRRPAAGGLPRGAHAAGARREGASCARPAAGPVRCRRARGRAAASAARLRIREQDRRRLGAAGVRRRRPRQGVSEALEGGVSPATRWSTSRSRWSTARSTRSTRPRWRSGWPASMAARTASRKADPACSSRS